MLNLPNCPKPPGGFAGGETCWGGDIRQHVQGGVVGWVEVWGDLCGVTGGFHPPLKPFQSCGSDKSLGFPSFPFPGSVMCDLGELGLVKNPWSLSFDPGKPNKAVCGLNEGLCFHLLSGFHFTS